MKAILEFNLPKEKDQFTLANMGIAFYATLTEIDRECGSIIKYKEKATKEEIELAELIRSIICDNVDLDCVS